MNELIDILKTRYQTAMESVSDSLFYQNIHGYIDLIKTTPEFSSIMIKAEKEYGEKFYEIRIMCKDDEYENPRQHELVNHLERFSLYASHYCVMEVRIYWPIEYYKNPLPDEQHGDIPDIVAIILLRGFDVAKEMRLWSNKTLNSFNKWFKGERKYYEDHLRQFHTDFLTEVMKLKNEKPLEIPKVPENKIPLHFDERTGDFNFYNTTSNIAPATQEYKILYSLLHSESYLCEYLPLYKALFPSTTEIRKAHKDTLAQIIRNLKKDLGILPKTKTSNIDIFENFKNHSYRLIFKDIKENTE